MTDLTKLRDELIEAAKRAHPPVKGDCDPFDPGPYLALQAAVTALRTAEEAARKPRLRRPGEFIDQERRRSNYQQPLFPTEVLAARDLEWLEATRARAFDDGTGLKVVSLADIEALAETAK